MKIGDVVTVEGSLAKDGSPTGNARLGDADRDRAAAVRAHRARATRSSKEPSLDESLPHRAAAARRRSVVFSSSVMGRWRRSRRAGSQARLPRSAGKEAGRGRGAGGSRHFPPLDFRTAP